MRAAHRGPAARLGLVAAAALALALVLAAPAAASAAVVWMSDYPLGTVHVVPTVVSVDVFGAAPVDARTAKLVLDGRPYTPTVVNGAASGHWEATETLGADGIWRIKWRWVADTGGTVKSTFSFYPPALAEGHHTVAVTATDTGTPKAGLSHAWTFDVSAPPVFGTPVPAPASTVETSRPVITIPVTDNGVVSLTTATVNGAPAAATLAGGVVTVSGFGPLPDGTATAEVTAVDAVGNRATRAWSFTVFAAAPAACPACHRWNGEAYDNAMGPRCASCHSGATAPAHGLTGRHDSPPANAACTGCHTGDLPAVHGAVGCICHVAPTPAIDALVAAGNAACTDCHTDGGHGPLHDTATATVVLPASGGVVCGDCHAPNLLTEHSKPTASSAPSGCTACHPALRATIATFDMQSCVQGGCHTAGSTQPMHGREPAAHALPAPAPPPSCTAVGCHAAADLYAIHVDATTTVAPGTVVRGCLVCHYGGVVPPSAACASCHGADPHAGAHATHDAAPPAEVIAISSVSFGSHACNECHTPTNLIDIHVTDCVRCHPTPKDTVAGTWAKGCVQGGCHTAGSTAPEHADIDAAHAIPADRADCLASGCHDAGAITPFAGRSVAAIHSAATTTVAGDTRTSCRVCHYAGSTLTAECATCHPERLLTHGYDPAKHISSEDCMLDCHSTELKPTHDAGTPPVNCSGCHPTAVAAVKPWDKTCTACHQTLSPATHPTPNTTHLGTDAAMKTYTATHQTYSVDYGAQTYAHGCTADPANGMISCHDVGNLAVLHQTRERKGCWVCHEQDGTPKTGAAECLTCHLPGEYQADPTVRTVTLTPNSDYGSPTATFVRTGAATNYETQLNNDGNTSNLQFTSTGRILLGFAAPSLPASAVISSVKITVLARKTNATVGTSRLGMSLYAGSTNSDAGSNAPAYSASVFTAFNQTWSTNPAHPGYNWTYQDLTDPNSPYGLKAIGANQSVNAAANIMITQVYATVTYTTREYVGAGLYHHFGVWNLQQPSVDATPGQLTFALTGAPNGIYNQLYYQRCLDLCHRWPNAKMMGNYTPVFSANQGSWMWYSVAGDPEDPGSFFGWSPRTRTLALRSLTLPAGVSTLQFSTNYQLVGGGNDYGYVEVSTNGGTSWTPLTGTVGGSSKASLTGSSAGWVPASYDLSAYQNSTIKLRFRFQNTPYAYSNGWGIDSLTITGPGGTIFSDDAETLKPDWDNSYWTRAQNAYRYGDGQ